MRTKQIYEFGQFRIDPEERLLLRDGRPVSLTPKAFETLLALVENSGHLVKKDELMKRVWPDAFVEEVNLAQNISAIRRALGEGNGSGQYIETVPKAGYRLSVNVRVVSEPKAKHSQVAPDAATADAATKSQQALQITQTALALATKRRSIAISVAAVLLLALGFFAWRVYLGLHAPAPVRSIVVLPLTNLSGDAQQEYFVDGITEALTTEVAKMSRVAPLRVISRTTAMRYKNASRAVPEIARELNIDAVLEGAVMRSGDHVRITAQLIRAANDEHIWAQSYDRNLADALAVQSEIAQDIAKQIKVQIAPEKEAQEATGKAPSVEAQDAYLRARYEWNKRTPQSLLRARTLFRQALDLEPNYALAWAGLAESEYLLTQNGYETASPREGVPRARAAAQRALELDDHLAEAHTSLGMVLWAYDWNWPAAEREYRRAIELNPNDAVAHQFYSIGLSSQGRFEESIAEAKHAIELDPLSPIIQANLARMLHFARRDEEAIGVLHKIVELEPNFFPGHQMLGMIAIAAGRTEEAVRELRIARELAPDSVLALTNLTRAYARSGQRQAALAGLEELKQIARKKYVPAYQFAFVYAELGEMDTAFQWLNKAIEEPSAMMMLMNVQPEFDTLRSDPRFAAVVRRVVPRN